MTATVDLIVNPASGPAPRHLPRHARLAYATQALAALGVAHVRATETGRPGDGALAAARAVADAVPTIVVWGGDGTLNDVAAQIIGSQTALGIVPGGSGNGLARALGLPLALEAAFAVAVRGTRFVADVGAVGGRPFLNIAGLGLDAGVAERFNRTGGTRRGLMTYIRSCAAELRAHRPARYRVHIDGAGWFDGEAHVVAVANGQQYGHNARIAPHARLDDGWLDVVVVTDVTLARVLRHGWRLFNGSIEQVPGVQWGRARTVDVQVTPTTGALLHLDGEVQPVTGPLHFAAQPQALLLRVPPVTGAGAVAAGPASASR